MKASQGSGNNSERGGNNSAMDRRNNQSMDVADEIGRNARYNIFRYIREIRGITYTSARESRWDAQRPVPLKKKIIIKKKREGRLFKVWFFKINIASTSHIIIIRMSNVRPVFKIQSKTVIMKKYSEVTKTETQNWLIYCTIFKKHIINILN